MDNPIGTRIRKRRLELGLTLEQVGEASFSTKSYIWELENKPGIRPSARKLQQVATALETTSDYLLDGVRSQSHLESLILRQVRKLTPRMREKVLPILKALGGS